MKKKIGLCLSGGGARGAYQIGAAKALADLGIFEMISTFSGTSIGAANVTVLASTSIEKARNIWFNIPKDALSTSAPLLTRLKTEKLKAIDNGIFTMDTFDSIMMSNIDHNKLSKKEVYVTVSESGDMTKGIFELFRSTYSHYIKKNSKVLYIPLQDLNVKDRYKAVAASCSIPIVFPPITNENKKYYDGGMFDNLPIRPLIDAGCDVIISITIAQFIPIFFKTNDYPNISFYEIKHKGSLGGVLDFNDKHSKKIYDYGYKDTIAFFKDIDLFS